MSQTTKYLLRKVSLVKVGVQKNTAWVHDVLLHDTLGSNQGLMDRSERWLAWATTLEPNLILPESTETQRELLKRSFQQHDARDLGNPAPQTFWEWYSGVSVQEQMWEDTLFPRMDKVSSGVVRKKSGRLPFMEANLLFQVRKNVNERRTQGGEKMVQTWSRDSTIFPNMVGLRIAVHNGRQHIPVFVVEEMVGHKLGEFAPTRFFRGHIKVDKKARRR